MNFPITHNPLQEFERKLDWVLDSLSDMCDAPITVWIEKLWDPLGHLILSWYVIDLKNVFTAYLRPGLYAVEGRNSRHWGGGKKGKPRTGFGDAWNRLGTVVGWDPNEVLGKGLWGADELRARPLPPGAQYLWIFEGVIERLFFYWMVVDLGTEFFYNWMSAVEETKYCQASRDAMFLADCGPYPLLGIFGWDTQGAFHPIKQRNISFFNGFGVMAHGGAGSAGGSAIIHLPDGGPLQATIQTRIRCLLGPSAGSETFSETIIQRGSTVTVGAGTAVASGDLIVFEIRVDAGMDLLKAHLFYQQRFVVPQ
jgi:hypothetical protein